MPSVKFCCRQLLVIDSGTNHHYVTLWQAQPSSNWKFPEEPSGRQITVRQHQPVLFLCVAARVLNDLIKFWFILGVSSFVYFYFCLCTAAVDIGRSHLRDLCFLVLNIYIAPLFNNWKLWKISIASEKLNCLANDLWFILNWSRLL